jgi:hypothetical protein
VARPGKREAGWSVIAVKKGAFAVSIAGTNGGGFQAGPAVLALSPGTAPRGLLKSVGPPASGRP